MSGNDSSPIGQWIISFWCIIQRFSQFGERFIKGAVRTLPAFDAARLMSKVLGLDTAFNGLNSTVSLQGDLGTIAQFAKMNGGL